MNNSNFLSIETSLNRIYLIILKKKEIFEVLKNNVKSVEIELNMLINEIMKNANISFIDLDYIMVSLGPGSFTGTRVGIAAAKAISVITGKKIIGFSNFETIYNTIIIKDKKFIGSNIEILVKAHKDSFFSQTFSAKNKYRQKMKYKRLEDIQNNYLERKFFIGNFKNKYHMENFTECWPSKRGYFEMIKNKVLILKKNVTTELNPFYIKEHYASK